jgi:hypothetical protein
MNRNAALKTRALFAAIGLLVAAVASADAQDVLSATSETGDMMSVHIAGPKRNAGWWEFTDVAQNGDELAKTHLCVGERSEAVYSAFDQISGDTCTSKRFEKNAGGYSYTTVCGVPGMNKVTTKGTLTGDIATAYIMDEVKDISVGGDRARRTARLIAPTCPAGYVDGVASTMGDMLKSSVLLGR